MPHVALPASEPFRVRVPLPNVAPVQPTPAAAMQQTAGVARPTSGLGGPLANISKEPVYYIFEIALGETTFKSFIFMKHFRQFQKEELDTMVAEAVRITNDVRIANRRKEMARGQAPIDKPKQINESLFATDVDFFEAVMADKYQFERIHANVIDAKIVPTVVVA